MPNITNSPYSKATDTFMKLVDTYPESYDKFLSAIKSERMYQEKVWSESTNKSKRAYTLPEWAVFLNDYINSARSHLSQNPEPQSIEMASDGLRKVAAMTLEAAEQNGFIDEFLKLTVKDVLPNIQSVNELFCYLQHILNKIFECFYNGANSDNVAIQLYFGQIFISIVDTISKTDNVIFRPED